VHDIDAGEKEIREKVEGIAKPYQDPQEVIDWYYGDKSRLSEIESLVFEDKIIEWVLDQVKVVEKATEFKELMAPKSGAA